MFLGRTLFNHFWNDFVLGACRRFQLFVISSQAKEATDVCIMLLNLCLWFPGLEFLSALVSHPNLVLVLEEIEHSSFGF